jgi:hypothetical protein
MAPKLGRGRHVPNASNSGAFSADYSGPRLDFDQILFTMAYLGFLGVKRFEGPLLKELKDLWLRIEGESARGTSSRCSIHTVS